MAAVVPYNFSQQQQHKNKISFEIPFPSQKKELLFSGELIPGWD